MIERYTKPEMGRFFTDVAQWDAARTVELAATKARAELGQVPEADLQVVLARTPRITEQIVKEIQEREAVTDHDVAAFVDTLQIHIDHPASRWLHYALTSADVTDTGLCLRLAGAASLLIHEAENFLAVLCNLARTHKTTITAGRTHGQHAEIITFAVRLTNWAQMVDRAISTLAQARSNIAVVKLSGACGTYTNIDPRVEELVGKELGLTPIVATQVVPRDLHADLVGACAKLGNALGHIFFNERIMAMTEVGEVEEGRRPGQKGSSAMPHKRNPIKGEQICGLARLLRGYLSATMENVELLFERDISHSAPERIVLADAMILAHYMVVTSRTVCERLIVKPDVMAENIGRTYGLMFTQTVLTELLDMGWERDHAYRFVQDLSEKVWKSKRHLRELLEEHEELYLEREQLDRIFDEGEMLKNVDRIIARLPR